MKHAKLLGRIIEKFGTRIAFAEAMGFSDMTLRNKLDGKVDWKMSEVKLACRLLDIPEDRISDFF